MPGLLARLALLLGLLAASGCGGPGGRPAPPLAAPTLTQIPAVVSRAGVATLTLRAALDPAGRPAFFWDGREVAPTIRVHPGDRIALHYVNDLPVLCGLGLISESNLHFHGLAAAPAIHSDDVIATRVRPGHAFDYTIAIGRDQPPGLYWYHPHPHGLANWEIRNGMSGAIVVEGIADRLPQLAGLREQVIVLRDIPVDRSVAAAERLTALKVQPAAVPLADPDEAASPCGVEIAAQPTINGQPSATIGIRPGERQLWRILNASAQRHFVIGLGGERFDLVAQDGVPLADATPARPQRSLARVVIPPAGRAEIVVTGAAGSRYLTSACFDAGPGGDVNPQNILALTIDDHGATALAHVAGPLGLAPATAATLPAPRVRRTLFFDEDAHGFTIDGRRYDPAAPPLVTARSGTLEEWTLVNRSNEVHTFHIHQVHFVVVANDEAANADRDWRDVVDLPPRRNRTASRVRVLVDFRDPVVRGTFLFHCHIVDHEDGGMMAKIRVI